MRDRNGTGGYLEKRLESSIEAVYGVIDIASVHLQNANEKSATESLVPKNSMIFRSGTVGLSPNSGRALLILH